MNCIINVSNGHWYPRGAQRQRDSLFNTGYCPVNKTIYWLNEYPKGCPTHSEIPYAFKPYAFQEAKEKNYTNVLWMDSAVWANKNPEPIHDIISREGYLIIRNGWVTGNWSTDEQLNAFGYSRDEAMEIPHAMACIVGINFDHPTGNMIHDELLKHIHLFKGAWSNNNQEVSPDPRVLGSRHDQTILSLIAHKNKLTFTNPQGIIDYNVTNLDSILLTQGM